MKTNRQHPNSTKQATAPVATLAESPVLEVEQLASFDAFSLWMAEELAQLEVRYQAFCTPDSLRGSVGR